MYLRGRHVKLLVGLVEELLRVRCRSGWNVQSEIAPSTVTDSVQNKVAQQKGALTIIGRSPASSWTRLC